MMFSHLLLLLLAYVPELVGSRPLPVDFPFDHFAHEGYEEPAFFQFYEALLGPDYLKRCARRPVPPNPGDRCRRRPKACLWGSQSCSEGTPGGPLHPRRRCNCEDRVWSCQDFECPTGRQGGDTGSDTAGCCKSNDGQAEDDFACTGIEDEQSCVTTQGTGLDVDGTTYTILCGWFCLTIPDNVQCPAANPSTTNPPVNDPPEICADDLQCIYEEQTCCGRVFAKKQCECQAGRPFSCLDVDICTDFSCDVIDAAIPENDSIILPDLVENSLAIAGCCRVPGILVGVVVDATSDGDVCTQGCCASAFEISVDDPTLCFAPEEEVLELTDELRKIYEANKKKWGNYQGICGTAIVDMAQNAPLAYQSFLAGEKAIEEQLKAADNEEEEEEEEEEESDFDEDMKDIYKENKRIWGNYQGICGTALLEMARNFPEAFKEFEENEKRIGEMLKED